MNYPDFQAIVSHELSALSKSLPRTSLKGRPPINDRTRLARHLGVGVETLRNWLEGRTFPRPDQLAKLVEKLRDTPAAQDLLRTQIEICGRDSSLYAASVSVATLDYWPFSGSPDSANQQSSETGTLDNILESAIRLTRREAIRDSLRTGINDAENLLRGNQSVANVCMFETPDRSVEFHTFVSSARISLNAVVLADSAEDRRVESQRHAVESLLLNTAPTLDHGAFRALALYPEVGYLHLKNSVRFGGLDETNRIAAEIPKLKLSATIFAEKLIRMHAESPGKICFAIVDEMTALRTIERLAREKRERNAPWSPVLVFPLATQASVQFATKRRLPIHNICVATVSNSDGKLVDLLTQGLKMLLESRELVVEEWRRLYERLRGVVHGLLKSIEESDKECHRRICDLQAEPTKYSRMWNEGCANQYALYALRLNSLEPMDTADVSGLPWKSILAGVRERLRPVPEGTESVREGRFRVGYLPLAPACEEVDTQELRFDLARSTLDLGALGFLGRLLRPFQHLADPVEVRRLVPVDATKSISEKHPPGRREDVWLGRLETYDRGRFWKFYRSPLFIPLNAVVLLADLKAEKTNLSELQRAISPFLPGADDTRIKQIREKLRFIVLDAGAGSELFLLRRDGFFPNQRTVETQRDPDIYYKKLIESRSPGIIPVLVVQVFNCLKVVKSARRNEIESSLVFPIKNAGDGIDRWMPEYNAAIAVNRESRTWIEFFDYAYLRYLREEPAELARLVMDFRSHVIKYLQSEVELNDAEAQKIADHFLCIDAQREGTLPEWESILGPVREKLYGKPSKYRKPSK